MNTFKWEDYLSTQGTRRNAWLSDLMRSTDVVDAVQLKTRVEVGGDHVFFRTSQRGSAVVSTFPSGDNALNRSPQFRRLLLSISYDVLCDWHLILGPSSIDVYNNRVVQGELIKKSVGLEELPLSGLGQILGIKREYSPSPDIVDISDSIVEKISHLKKSLIGDPARPRLSDLSAVDDILNGVIFLRYIEDSAKSSRKTGYNIGSLLDSRDAKSFWSLLSTVFQSLSLGTPNCIVNEKSIRALPASVVEIIFDWYKSFYRDSKNGGYEYDFGLIAEYSLGQIYEKYIALVGYHTNNGSGELFPEYATEFQWQKGTGSMYTPEYLARFLTRRGLSNFEPSTWKNLNVGDLACGSAVFLRSFLIEVQRRKKESGGIKKETLAHLWAVDKNSSALAAARLSIVLTTLRHTSQLYDSFHPIQADSLKTNLTDVLPSDGLDLILMNPPFKGYQSQSEDERALASKVLGKHGHGRFDYAWAFLKKALESLREGGSLCVILPASFLDSSSAHSLRSYICELGSVEFVAKIEDNALFERGQTQISMVSLVKRKRKSGKRLTQVLFCRSSTDLAIRAVETQQFDSRYEWEFFESNSSDWDGTWTLIPERIQHIIEGLSDRHPTVGTIFNIKQCIKVGLEKAFVISDVGEFPVKERRILKPIADDKNTYPWRIEEDGRRLIYAYRKREPISESEMRLRFPVVMDHLLKYEDKLKTKSREGLDQIWSLVRPRDPELMFAPKIVTPNFSLAGCYALDLSGTYAVTSGSILTPQIGFTIESMWYFYVAILNSSFFLRLLDRRGRKLKGGYYDFDQRFTKNIPLPSYSSTSPPIRKELETIARSYENLDFKDVNQEVYELAVMAAYQVSQSDALMV